MKQRIIIVSNRLPVSITKGANSLQLQRSTGGLATALSALMDGPEYTTIWAGWPGSEGTISQHDLRKAGWDSRLVPVPLSGELFRRFYERMSNGILWPLLHGLEPTTQYDRADWNAYMAANRRFAATLRGIITHNDIIWIHDYHLLPLPQLLREAGVANRIGFFLHSPFASAGCLASLEHYTNVVRSLAYADVLGFQTQRDTDNFRESLRHTNTMLRPNTTVQTFPIGVDYESYQSAAHKPAVRRFMSAIQNQVQGRQAILSVSRLDYTKGIPQQLQAVEALLDQSDDPSRYLYKLIVAPSREDVAGYGELRGHIEQEVTRINHKFRGKTAQPPIDYSYRSFGFDELAAWYRAAQVLLVTPIIDGMNLVVKEYIAARQDMDGMVVMSKTIGAAGQLHHSLLVDPHDIPGIARALQSALTMPINERSFRWNMLLNNIQDQDVHWWIREFLGTLESKAQSVLFADNVHTPRLFLVKRLRTVPRLHFVRHSGQLTWIARPSHWRQM